MISIIMAAYNAEKTIQMAIDSVLRQTYKDFELIVIDDNSLDKTQEIINQYKKKDCRIKSLKNKKNMGVSKTRHHGLKYAQGEWIAILDSDDAWEPEKLQKQMILQNKTGGKLIFTGSAFMDDNAHRLNYILHIPGEINYKKLLRQNLISNSSVLVSKTLYEANEVLDDSMHEDFACWLKILRTGEVAYGLDEPLLIYRLSSSGKTKNKKKAALMNWRTYRHVGLSICAAAYYESWYIINGVLKYRQLK